MLHSLLCSRNGLTLPPTPLFSSSSYGSFERLMDLRQLPAHLCLVPKVRAALVFGALVVCVLLVRRVCGVVLVRVCGAVRLGGAVAL